MLDPAQTGTPAPRSLKPAGENPWYVLATIHGELDPQMDPLERIHRHEKNRRIWNGWSCGHLAPEERVQLAKQAGIKLAETEPWTDDEHALVASVFLERLGGTVDIPDPLRGVHFGETLFDLPLEMSCFVFSGGTTFAGATFNEDAAFCYVVFSGSVHFERAIFSADVAFMDTTFSGGADFTDARFVKQVLFASTMFGGWAGFSDTKFGGDAFFTEVSFSEGAVFFKAAFSGYATFDATEFEGDARFHFVEFTESTYFTQTKFRHIAGFDWANFGKTAEFKLTQFDNTASFIGAKFKTKFPDFSGSILHQNTVFTTDDKDWPPIGAVDPEKSGAALAIIRHAVGKQGRPEDEHYFFRREMDCATRIGGFWRRLPYRLYRDFSEFGYSIQLPARGLLLLWFGSGLLYLLAGLTGALPAASNPAWPFGLSFANLFGFFGLHRLYSTDPLSGAAPWVIVLSAIQTIMGFVYVFFLGLGLRTRPVGVRPVNVDRRNSDR